MIHGCMEEITYRAAREPLVPPGGIDCHVRDMTATASADVTLDALQAELARHGQWLPIDGNAAQALGVLVSADSTGPLRLGYGAWRDLLLGAQFTTGRGELVSVGGRTVKNVAGYDLTKFMVGQRGVFGRLVTVTTRTYRRPAGAIIVRHAPAVQIVSRLIPSMLKPQWAALTSEALWCGYLGDEPTLAFYQSALVESRPLEIARRSGDEDIRHRSELWSADAPVVFRASVPPAKVGEFTSTLARETWSADAAFGVVLGAAQDWTGIQRSAADVGGSARIYRGAYGPPIDLSTSPPERLLIGRLKRAFDPDNRLNPLPWSPA